MAIQTQFNYNPSTMNPFQYPPISSGSHLPLINNNGGFGIGIQQPQFLHQQQYPPQQQYSLTALMAQHSQETDQFIRSEREKLRFMVAEQMKEGTNMIMRKMGGTAMALMAQKDEEIGNALNKKMKLENMIREMQKDNETWKRLAEEKEALVYKLKNALKEAKERAVEYEAACEDACSVAEEGGGGGGGGERINCLTCGREGEKTRVVFLPCRHLCCCRYCESSNYLCPLCNTFKKSSIEATIP